MIASLLNVLGYICGVIFGLIALGLFSIIALFIAADIEAERQKKPKQRKNKLPLP